MIIICPYVSIKSFTNGFVVMAVYMDDLNLVGTPHEIASVASYMRKEFEIKDLGKTKLCLGIQIEHLSTGIFIHQSTYTKKMLMRFNMDKAYPLSTPMVVRTLNVLKDPFRPLNEGEIILRPETPCLNAIGTLMYFTNNTKPDIAFAVNLLARCNSTPMRRHWK